MGEDVLVGEGHVRHDEVHPDDVGDRRGLALVLGADLAGLLQPFVAEERVRRHCGAPSSSVSVAARASMPRPEPCGRRNPTRLAGRLPVRDRSRHPRCRALFGRRRRPRRARSCTASPATPSRCAGSRSRWPTRGSPWRCRLLPGHGTDIADMVDDPVGGLVRRCRDGLHRAGGPQRRRRGRRPLHGGDARRVAGRAPSRDRGAGRRQPAALAARRGHACRSSRR